MLSTENGGTIVTVSSVLGQLCPTGLSDYAASKAGLSALHRTVEAEIRAAGQEDQIKMLLVETGQIATPLFDWVDTPNSFFAPVLEPVQVAREIVAAVDGGRGGVLRLPAYAKLANWFVVLPAAVQRIARFVSGMDDAVAKGASSQGQAAAASGRAPGGAVDKKRA
jgi:NAD(P)-dependent dehydrogenase (short-subunit alcohol dehydrogenase family)